MNSFNLLFLCTGNAARSVMARAMMEEKVNSQKIDNIKISSAGTLAIENLPTSIRVEKALNIYGLSARKHRSRQLTEQDITWANLIVGFEPQHIEYVRLNHPTGATKTTTLVKLANLIPQADITLKERILDLRLDKTSPYESEELADPDRGGDDEMQACAKHIAGLLEDFWGAFWSGISKSKEIETIETKSKNIDG